LLSTRADLLGDEITEDLTQLQDRLPPFPGAQARALIEAEFERPLTSLFTAFDDTAIAAASIAQVHFAITTEGTEVAVKVLRPGIARAMARDLDLFLWLARLAERTQPHLRRLKPVEVVETLAQSVQLEMDLRFEAAAASELAENFAGDTSFRVPRIDWLRTGRTVLTTERIAGIRVDDRAALIAAGHDVAALLRNAAGAFFKQVFRDGFFHADLHPGNMFVDSDGALAVVDFGIMGRLDRQTRYYLADMLIGFLTGDYRLDRRLYTGLPLDRRTDPREALERDLDRAAPGAAVSRHRAIRHGDAAATPAAAKDDGAGRGRGAAARPHGQYLEPGAAAGRGMGA
jgi:ubiquinone biosynthesis protein